VLLVAGWLRFVDLGRAAVRADEITFLEQVARGQTVFDLWQNPPWLNQIPFVDTFTIIWNGLRPGPPDEGTVREPYALVGTLTVVGVAAWLARRRGVSAAVFVGLWMSLLPYHLYQSREAYYYVAVMALAGGMTLQTVDMLVRVRGGEPPTLRAYAAWTAWAVATCLTHMSTWAVALACWSIALATGVRSLPEPRRRGHVVAMAVAAAVIGLLMKRWVGRAVSEALHPTMGGDHIGLPFAWVAPRVIPFFTAGDNAFGLVASVALVAAGVYVFAIERRRSDERREPLYDSLTVVTVIGFAAEFAYVGLVGGGKGKVTYFSAVLPVFLAWSAYTLDVVAASLPGRWPAITKVALPCVALTVLAQPAWMVTQIDGKPSPYKQIRDWLDANLDPGSVVLVDRWLEPWNEMARYAPRKVFVTFTVPDHPYETYLQLKWRDVTRQFIEQGGAQAFIRLTRNHEDRDGLWTWPEQHFARRAEIVNEAAVWLRRHGYDALQPSSTSSTHQLVTEIFFDLRADVVARKRAAGERFVLFFDETLRYEKSGPMGIFRVQSPQFMDWRVLAQAGTFEVHNLTDKDQKVLLKLRGVAPGGPKVVIGPAGERHDFNAGEIQNWFMGPVVLEPGATTVSLADPRWDERQSPLFIAGIEIEPVTDSGQ
jgi:hypothetical protein